jgi:Integrase zinc binding domain/Integrase core domain/RNase H-like domain found in reverse transcriptase
VQLLRPYLEGRHFRVRSDQSSLSWIFSSSSINNPRLARFRLKLAGLSFSVGHIPGNRNKAADGLSRCETGGTTVDSPGNSGFDDIPCCVVLKELPPRPGPLLEIDEWSAITVIEMREAQETDDYCQSYRNKEGWEEDSNGLLMRVSPLDNVAQIIVPQSMRERLLTLGHYPKSAGHPGGDRLFRTIRREFYWPAMAADCRAFVSRCPSRAAKQLKSQKKTSHMKLFPPNAPLEFVGIDILGPLPVTRDGNRFLLIITDRYYKLTKAVPMRKITANEVSCAFFVHWIACYVVPLILLSDNGAQFVAKFFQAICTTLGVKQLFTSAYHPQCNGQTERFNRTVLGMLVYYVSKQQDDWDKCGRACLRI